MTIAQWKKHSHCLMLSLAFLSTMWALPAIASCPGGTYTVTLTGIGSAKLEVVKAVKSLTGLDLKQAKDLVDMHPSKVGEDLTLNDAQTWKSTLEKTGATAQLAGPHNCPAQKQKTPPPTKYKTCPGGTYTVKLTGWTTSKVWVVKVVKSLTGLGQKAAKKVVVSAPVVIQEGLSQTEAQAWRLALKGAGAKAKLVGPKVCGK